MDSWMGLTGSRTGAHPLAPESQACHESWQTPKMRKRLTYGFAVFLPFSPFFSLFLPFSDNIFFWPKGEHRAWMWPAARGGLTTAALAANYSGAGAAG